jgi:uncharacterized cupin superfamily protein
MPNVFDPSWDTEQEQDPFSWRRARLGRQAGSENLGASLYELPAGASTWPLHIHHANEELIVVLAGTPTLRSLEDERELVTGEVVACRTGRTGAHRLDNRSDEPVRVIVISTMISPELNEYPDSGKLLGLSFAPGGQRGKGDVEVMARSEVSRTATPCAHRDHVNLISRIARARNQGLGPRLVQDRASDRRRCD